MIAGVIGLPCPAFDDDTFRTTTLSGALWFYVILSILAARQPLFTILKRPAPYITRRRIAASIQNRP